jgi:hypothetical protein
MSRPPPNKSSAFIKKGELLYQLTFGGRVAEEEANLEDFFVETTLWKELFDGQIDIVYGAKGAGKSALYSFVAKAPGSLG